MTQADKSTNSDREIAKGESGNGDLGNGEVGNGKSGPSARLGGWQTYADDGGLKWGKWSFDPQAVSEKRIAVWWKGCQSRSGGQPDTLPILTRLSHWRAALVSARTAVCPSFPPTSSSSTLLKWSPSSPKHHHHLHSYL